MDVIGGTTKQSHDFSTIIKVNHCSTLSTTKGRLKINESALLIYFDQKDISIGIHRFDLK